jgi:peptidoglycan/LPS O-acetylase OafA/YrhL
MAFLTTALYQTFVSIGFACAILLVVAAEWRGRWCALLRWAGIGAFSIYLFHEPARGVAIALLGFPPLSAPIVPVLSAAVVVPVAWLCWVAIEKPCIAYGHRRWPGRPRRAQAALDGPFQTASSAPGQ